MGFRNNWIFQVALRLRLVLQTCTLSPTVPSNAARTALLQESGIPGGGGNGKVCALLQSCRNTGGELPTNRVGENPFGVEGGQPFEPPDLNDAVAAGNRSNVYPREPRCQHENEGSAVSWDKSYVYEVSTGAGGPLGKRASESDPLPEGYGSSSSAMTIQDVPVHLRVMVSN